MSKILKVIALLSFFYLLRHLTVHFFWNGKDMDSTIVYVIYYAIIGYACGLWVFAIAVIDAALRWKYFDGWALYYNMVGGIVGLYVYYFTHVYQVEISWKITRHEERERQILGRITNIFKRRRR